MMQSEKTVGQGGEGDLFPRPHVTIDVVIFSLRQERLCVLLMKRKEAPFRDEWSLPGGYIHPEEDRDLEMAARRILRQKAGIETPYLEQLQGFGDAMRDPRGWTATFAHFALIASEHLEPRQGANAAEVGWWSVDGEAVAVPLAFDHDRILAAAVTRLRNKVEYTTLPVHLLPEHFTLPDLQKVYEQVLGRKIDKSHFRKRMAEADFLEAVVGERRLASNRPAQIYRLKPGMVTIFFDRTL